MMASSENTRRQEGRDDRRFGLILSRSGGSSPQSFGLDHRPGRRRLCRNLYRVARRRPDVAEVAWLECAMHRAFTAADCEPLTPAGFAVATAGYETGQREGLRLNFMPGTAVRPVTHNLVKLWATLAEPGQRSDVVKLREPQCVLLWREAERPVFVLVPAIEGRALAGLWDGGTFGAVCAGLANIIDPEEAAAKAGALLICWLEMGVICSIRS